MFIPGELQAVLLRYALAALVAVALGATCFAKGCEYAQDRQKAKDAEVVLQKVEVTREVTVGQEKIAAAYRAGRASGEAKFAGLDEELRKTKGERDAKAATCDLSDHDLRVLNSTRVARRPAADSVGPAGGVLGAGGPAGREAEHAGGGPAARLERSLEVPRPPQGSR